MTFLVAQLHVPMHCECFIHKKTKKKKPKTHYKCITVMVHVVKFWPKNKTTKFYFFKVMLFWMEQSRCEERP
jgi:hypothetical protein